MHKVRLQKTQNPQQSASISKNISLSASKTQQNVLPINQLWLQLSRYRELKQLPLNPVSEPKDQLWRDSPCTIRCTNRNISLDKVQRFRIGSIYYRDDINGKKKVFTQSEKPQLMLKNFRRQIQQSSHSKRKYNRKITQLSVDKAIINQKLGQTTPLIENKFYEVPNKIELKYDRNGTRSSFKGEYDIKTIIDNFRANKPNFTSSRRIDLSLPLNFNPGPGNYFIQSEDFTASQTHRSKRLNYKMHQNQISERKPIEDSIKQA